MRRGVWLGLALTAGCSTTLLPSHDRDGDSGWLPDGAVTDAGNYVPLDGSPGFDGPGDPEGGHESDAGVDAAELPDAEIVDAGRDAGDDSPPLDGGYDAGFDSGFDSGPTRCIETDRGCDGYAAVVCVADGGWEPTGTNECCFTTGRFTVSAYQPGMNTVFDSQTGLTWWQANGSTVVYIGETSCQNYLSSDGGASGWRLPTEAELRSIFLAPNEGLRVPICSPDFDNVVFPYDIGQNYLISEASTAINTNTLKLVTVGASDSIYYKCVHD